MGRFIFIWQPDSERKRRPATRVDTRPVKDRAGAREHFAEYHLALGFGRANPKAGASITIVPFWFPMFLFATGGVAAAAPWIKWRFSVRTLIIATTLVAVVLGIVVYVAR